MIPFLRAKIEAPLLRKNGLGGPPFAEGEIDRATEFVEAVLLDWMGHGGDLFFLEMFILANQALPSMSIFVVQQSQLLTDSIKSRRAGMVLGLKSYCRKHSIKPVDFGFREGDHVLPEANDRLFHELAESGPEELQSALLLEQRAVTLSFPDQGLVLLLDTEVNYRVDLMGELATPWENMPPPYGPYQSRRQP